MRHALDPGVFTSCLVGVVALALGGCNAQERVPADASPARNVDIDDLHDDPRELAGSEVRVIGEIDDPSHGDHAFVIEGDDWLFAGEVLVISATPMQLGGEPLDEGEDVAVTGTVRIADMPAMEREVGWPISEGMADDWDGKAIIVASSVRSLERGAVWTADPASQ